MDLKQNNPEALEQLRVNAKDRMYQAWERNPLSVDIYSEKVMKQKLEYIHANPMQEKWKLCGEKEEYAYSSAGFYERGRSEWPFLTHYLG